MRSRRSPFDCYEDVAVDVLELLHRGGGGRKERFRFDDGCGPFSGGGGYGDYFYSFVKFHAAHLNHLARLGIAHAEYARRAMEALYGGCGYGTGAPEPDLWFVGKPDDELSKSFTVDNRCGPEDAKLAVTCSRFRKGPDDEGFSLEPKFTPANVRLKKYQQKTIEMTLTLDPKKVGTGSKYFATVEVELADEVVDTLLVCVDVRSP